MRDRLTFGIASLLASLLAHAPVAAADSPQPASRPIVSLSQTEQVLREHTKIPSSTVLTLSRTGPTDAPLTVRLTTNENGGQAWNGVDVERIPDQIVIPSGKSSVDIPIKAINDDIVERDERFTLYVLASDDYQIDITRVSSGLLIEDNDFWRWAAVTPKAVPPIAVKRSLADLDGWFDKPASFTADGSMTVTDNSVEAELVATLFDGGLLSDMEVISKSSLKLSFNFDPVSGQISRNSYLGSSAISGQVPVEIARSVVIDNTAPHRHTALVTIGLVAAANSAITIAGDGFHEVGRSAPAPPLTVTVKKLRPGNLTFRQINSFRMTLEQFEHDAPEESVAQP